MYIAVALAMLAVAQTFQDTLCDIFNVSNEYKISWCYPGDKSTETVTYQWPLVQHYTPGPGGDIGDRIYHGYMGLGSVSVQVAWQI